MRISDWSSDVCSSDLLSFPLLVAAGTTGSLLGAVFWYIIGRWLGCDRLKRWADRHGRWMTMSLEDVDKAAEWFGRHAGKAVLFGRLVPAVRTLISVPEGIDGMEIGRAHVCTPGTNAQLVCRL